MKIGKLYEIKRKEGANLLLSLYKNCNCVDKQTGEDIHVRHQKSIYVMYIGCCKNCFEHRVLYNNSVYSLTNLGGALDFEVLEVKG